MQLNNYKLLESIKTPSDLKKIELNRLPQLADEIRQFIIQTVSKTGGASWFLFRSSGFNSSFALLI